MDEFVIGAGLKIYAYCEVSTLGMDAHRKFIPGSMEWAYMY